MSMRCYVLGLLAGLIGSATPARAILIETKEGNNPVQVGGFLIRDDGTNLTIRIRTPDGQEQDATYSHARIKVLHRLDGKRLESLSSDAPKAYRDYAEELARQKNDPEARHTAMRLYLIAARLAPDRWGPSSLLAMSELASTPAEARKCRALAFLLDPRGGPELLKAEVARPAPPDRTRAPALEDFTRALSHYRAGRIPEAMATAKKGGVEKIFDTTPFQMDQKTFLQWCADATCTNCNAKTGKALCPECKGRGVVTSMFGLSERCSRCNGTRAVVCPDCGGRRVRDPLPDQTLRVVLQCELWALDLQGGGEEAGRKEPAEPKGWSSLLRAGRLDPVLGLSLETVTDFDPRKCRYRNGKWVEE